MPRDLIDKGDHSRHFILVLADLSRVHACISYLSLYQLEKGDGYLSTRYYGADASERNTDPLVSSSVDVAWPHAR